ncbi:hypothetical protein C5G87_06080 [Paenibacillus peoriae]|nr:hypothetical protein PPYC1_04450 [Paenibacillus polymyxa]OMF41339.1 hypothetical protein BK135_20790 [Paenibacillus peoriae]PPQ49732.1 hypothetical protein C5G87_06080 [Paenibacillus peoriae]
MGTISAPIVFSKEHREVLFLYSFSNIYLIDVQFASVPRQRLNCKGFYPIIKNVISKFGAAFFNIRILQNSIPVAPKCKI